MTIESVLGNQLAVKFQLVVTPYHRRLVILSGKRTTVGVAIDFRKKIRCPKKIENHRTVKRFENYAARVVKRNQYNIRGEIYRKIKFHSANRDGR